MGHDIRLFIALTINPVDGEWFDIASDDTPEGVVPDVGRDRYRV